MIQLHAGHFRAAWNIYFFATGGAKYHLFKNLYDCFKEIIYVVPSVIV